MLRTLRHRTNNSIIIATSAKSIAEYTCRIRKAKATVGMAASDHRGLSGYYPSHSIRSIKPAITPVILNLCDGDEVNGTPGISVVKLLEQLDLVYTGADSYFCKSTTSKVNMKRPLTPTMWSMRPGRK
ncbi:MAG: hypothetical protein IPF70_16300 [Saprospiraceae bacterium]|nr:hypothetical protein [Saprospiraceae bacterium]